jgi:uncharacterized protein (DUF488 family)
MRRFDLFSIGHSNIAIDRFVGMLHSAGVNAVADVRSTPVSRHCPWFSAKNLVTRLQQEGMYYVCRPSLVRRSGCRYSDDRPALPRVRAEH